MTNTNRIRRTLTGLILASLLVGTSEARTRYVSQGNPNATSPFTNWATAAASLQAALDACTAGDLVMVTNGFFSSGVRVSPGGSLSNRVVIPSFVWVQSVNGAQFTTIAGAPAPSAASENLAVRCAYLGNGARLIGFTLINGHTLQTTGSASDKSGGGAYAWGAELRDCVVRSNSAVVTGGGVYGGALNNCTLQGNIVYGSGGGAYWATLNNCLLQDNAALDSGLYGSGSGGGAATSTLNNCMVSTNRADYEGGGVFGGTASNCVLIANYGAAHGGGACGSTLLSSTVLHNRATGTGGGAHQGALTNCVLFGNAAQTAGGAFSANMVNCTLSGNSATETGGAHGGGLYNCVVYYNLAPNNPNVAMGGYYYTCAPNLSGNGCISNAPLFVDAATGNLHLQASSPCRNVGTNLTGLAALPDRDGHTRISEGIVDMGAYEYTPAAGPMFQAIWKPVGQAHIALRWGSEAGAKYNLLQTSAMTGSPAWTLLATNLAATPPSNTYTDVNATAVSPRRFYRLQRAQ